MLSNVLFLEYLVSTNLFLDLSTDSSSSSTLPILPILYRLEEKQGGKIKGGGNDMGGMGMNSVGMNNNMAGGGMPGFGLSVNP